MGPLTRKYRGFATGGGGGIHDVLDANGLVVATGLSKADADAMVAKGLPE